MNHLDLFSGIGGFRVALDLCHVTITTSYHSDIDDFANKVYAHNYPDSIPVGDVRGIDGHALRAKHPGPWILTGGFPCQDISDAGFRRGLQGERSGLWYEMLRVINELKPEVIFIENVAALKDRGLIDVLRGLDQAGYMGQWRTLSAQEVGGLHLRKRLWITAHHRNSNRDVLRADDVQPEGNGNLGDIEKRRPEVAALLTRAEWETAKATRSFLGKPLADRKADGLSPASYKSWRARNRALGNAIVPQCAAKVLQDWITQGDC